MILSRRVRTETGAGQVNQKFAASRALEENLLWPL
jgi:hypothetical protein